MNKKKMKKIYAFILYFFIVLLGIIMFTYETITQHDNTNDCKKMEWQRVYNIRYNKSKD